MHRYGMLTSVGVAKRAGERGIIGKEEDGGSE